MGSMAISPRADKELAKSKLGFPNGDVLGMPPNLNLKAGALPPVLPVMDINQLEAFREDEDMRSPASSRSRRHSRRRSYSRDDRRHNNRSYSRGRSRSSDDYDQYNSKKTYSVRKRDDKYSGKHRNNDYRDYSNQGAYKRSRYSNRSSRSNERNRDHSSYRNRRSRGRDQYESERHQDRRTPENDH